MKKLIIAILLIFFTGFVVRFATAQSERNPQSYVENLVRSFVVAEGRDVRFDALSIALNGNVTAKGISVYDKEGEWLKITNFALDWSPLSLLGSTVEINRFSVDTIDIKRLPKSEQSAGEESGATPKPFVLKQFDLKKISLGEPLAGQAMTLTASGNAATTLNPVVIAVDVSARRIDATKGALDAKIAYSPVEDTLKLDVALEEAANGALSSLLKIAGAPKIALAIKGDGKLDRWAGDLGLTLDEDKILAGAMTISRDGKGRRIKVDLEGDLTRLLPASAHAIIGGKSALNGEIGLLDDGTIELYKTEVRSRVAALSATGLIDPKGNRNDLRWVALLRPDAASGLNFTLSSGKAIAIGAADLKGALRGALATPAFNLEGTMATFGYADLRLEGMTLQGSSAARSSDNALSLTLSGTVASGLSQQWPKPFTGPFQGSVHGRYGAGQPFDLSAARLDFQEAFASLTGTLVPATGAIDLVLDAKIDDLMRAQENFAKFFPDKTALKGRIKRAANHDTITLEGIELDNPAITTRLSGTYSARALALQTSGILKDINRLHQKAAGTLTVDARLSGDPAAPTIKARIGGEAIELSGNRLDDLKGTLSGVLSEKAPDIDLDIKARYRDAPLQASAQVKTTPEGKRLIEDITLQALGADITGALELTDKNLPVGHIRFDIASLSTLGELALSNLRGALKGEISLLEQSGALSASILADGRDIEAQAIITSSVKIDASLEGIGDVIKPSGNLDARDVVVAGNHLGQIKADITPEDGGYTLDLASNGKDIVLTSKAHLKTDKTRTHVRLQQMRGKARSIPFDLVQPAEILIEAGTTTLAQTLVAVGGGRITAKGVLSPDADVELTATSLPLSIADTLDGALDVAGTLNAQARFTTKNSASRIAYDVTITGFSTAASRGAGVPALTITSTGDTQNNTLSLKSAITGPQDVAFTIIGTVGLGTGNPLDLAVQGAAPLSLLADQAARQGVRLEGGTQVDLKVRGTASAPDIAGTFSLINAKAGDTDGKLIVENLNATAILAEQRIRITALNGTIGKDGTLQGRGILELNEALQTDFNVQIENGTYSDDTLVVATFNADLRLQGALRGAATLSGNIDLLKTLITLKALPASAIKVGNVVHLRPPVPVARQQARLSGRSSQQQNADGGLLLDLKIANTRPILVRGRGINADFGGKLRLSGPSAAPIATGEFTLLRGTIDIIGQTLTFDRGAFTFAGSLTPRIDIAASSSVSGTTVTLGLVGPAETPQVVISSSPEIPDEEALALLIFSRQASDLSPLQLARLADALLTLSGGRRTSVFESFRRGLGVDRLDVTTDEAGNSAIGVGRYINQRTYFGVEQGIESGKTRATINLDITRKLKLQGSVDSEGETKASVIFQHEY